MNVIVDTCIWSSALRHRSPDRDVAEKLTELISEGRVIMLGPIRQEILSGVPDKKQFQKLKKRLSAFPDLVLRTEHYETAAQYYNKCREKGVQGSHIDFLICAVSALEKVALYTVDKDFDHYKKYLSIKLYK